MKSARFFPMSNCAAAFLGLLLAISSAPLQLLGEVANGDTKGPINSTQLALIAAAPISIAAIRLISHVTDKLGLAPSMLVAQAVSLGIYHLLHDKFKQPVITESSTTAIAYISLHNQITEIDKLYGMLETCKKNSSIKGVIITINSLGGDLGICQALFHEIKYLALQKPVVVLIEKQACKEAYLVASAATAIVANEHAVIGMIGTSYQFKKEKEGQLQDLSFFYAGSMTALFDATHSITAEEQHFLTKVLEKQYQQLCKDIAAQRHLALHEQQLWADGRPFIGNEALAIHLIDHIGSLTDAYRVMSNLLTERGIEHGNFTRVALS